MHGHSLIGQAAAPTVAIVRAIRADQLTAPTPCQEYDVRRLLHHLLYWGPSLEGAARGSVVAPPADPEPELELTGDDWVGSVTGQVDRLATAWSDPAAWEGTTQLGGPPSLPAAIVGGMVLTELVVHGWDLARATGQPPQWDDRVLAFVHREVAGTAEQGRQLGVYGPLVRVPGTAPVLDQLLGLTGRDPRWSASRAAMPAPPT